jgi:ABC-type dipeptide/oligopeptide/nickel transport system permease subunit
MNQHFGLSLKFKKLDSVEIFSLCVLALYLLLGGLAFFHLIAQDFDLVNNLQTYLPPSSQHWLGTDIFGRDVLARAIHGTNTAFSVGVVSSFIALVIGVTLGALAGYFGGWVDDVIVWFYTTLDSIPYILLLAAFAFVLGPGLTNVYLALGLTGWVTLCRMVRGEVLKQREMEYVMAATALGYGHFRKIFHHLLPNILHIIVVQSVLNFIAAIKIEVILSYLGLGVEPGTPSWGMMIDDAKLELARGIWWNLAAASLFMFGLVLSCTLLIESLRRRLDPKSLF